MHALVNGEVCDARWARDRGFAYGDGVFETMRVVDGEVTLCDLHLERLWAGSERLGIASRQALQDLIEPELAEFSRALGTGVVKLMLSRGVGGRGYAPPEHAEPTRVLLGFPLPEHPDTHYSDGVSVRICALRLGKQPVLAGIKHMNRLEQVMARSEWQGAEFAEGILMDAEGDVIEATAMNLFIVEGDSLVTPALETCGVAGVMRKALMRAFAARNSEVQEERISQARMLAADEIFLSNSVVGVWPVHRLDGQQFSVGRFARAAQDIAAEVLKLPVRVSAS